jgi:hypothetical protein
VEKALEKESYLIRIPSKQNVPIVRRNTLLRMQVVEKAAGSPTKSPSTAQTWNVNRRFMSSAEKLLQERDGTVRSVAEET